MTVIHFYLIFRVYLTFSPLYKSFNYSEKTLYRTLKKKGYKSYKLFTNSIVSIGLPNRAILFSLDDSYHTRT